MTDDARLPPLLKVLISADGTISNMLEAWFSEAVVAQVDQTTAPVSDHDLLMLDASPGDEVICRSTQIVGKSSSTTYLRATAVILADRVPAQTLACIEKHEAGIGKALRQARSETLREVLDWGVDEQSNEVWRCYRIVMTGQPVMLITEHFPIETYKSATASN
ncbi:hypothetical protein GCM10011369_32940 [Neiella marina]|uniref:DUF98 domain-containing protein n=1 Tax=Neiella marina TaxID=508461 RepID=A0A8J2XR98_9GAMM|nr:hypothetical protein [Neiella marina]GGA88210.1 hypothetical protein GCM10011369_32940 [Neiella marina]